MTGVTGPGRSGRPARLSLAAILAAAEAIVAEDGIDALTMRRLARDLDSSPMALYRHVRGKDDLVVLLLDHLASRLPRPELPADPRTRLIALWTVLHDELARHPWVVEVLVQGNLMAPSVLWFIEEVLAAFVDYGLSREQAAEAYRAVWQLTVGELTIRHAMRRHEGVSRFQLAVLATAEVDRPHLAALANYWRRPWSYADNLGALVDGLLAPAETRRGRRRVRRPSPRRR